MRFLETSEGFVLAELGDADSRVMLVVELLPDGAQPRVVELPDAELASPVTLGTLHARYSGAATLRCDGTECVVNTGWDREVGFSDQVRVELEALGESQLEGVFSRGEAARCTPDHRVCVYGSGLHCLVAGGGWDTLIAPLSGQRIRSGSGGNGCTPTLAVGDEGLVLRRASGGWEPVAYFVTFERK